MFCVLDWWLVGDLLGVCCVGIVFCVVGWLVCVDVVCCVFGFVCVVYVVCVWLCDFFFVIYWFFCVVCGVCDGWYCVGWLGVIVVDFFYDCFFCVVVW